jgi:hypothetical protein
MRAILRAIWTAEPSVLLLWTLWLVAIGVILFTP